MKDKIKFLEVDTKILESCDISVLIRLFKEMKRENARILMGKIMLTFPKYDQDRRPNCIIPEIRKFIQKINNNLPNFPFFYVDEKVLVLICNI